MLFIYPTVTHHIPYTQYSFCVSNLARHVCRHPDFCLTFSVKFAGRREDVDEKGSDEVRTTVSSTIRFRPTIEDNMKAVTCEAQHPALQSGPLTASLNIFVQRKF